MKLKCPFCGHEWTPRAVDPKSCPRCKRYFTKDKQPEKLDVEEISLVRVPPTIKCEYCNRNAQFFVAGKNVCRQHVSKALEDEAQPDIDYVSIVETSNSLQEAIRRALIENQERLPESEVIKKVNDTWLERKGMPSW